MMLEKRQLRGTDFTLGRIGISSSFGADVDVFEEAFERGCNYFNWGTFIKGRSGAFRQFLRGKEKAGMRERIVLGLLSYSHSVFLGNVFLESALKQLGTDYIDSLILGYFSQKPPQRLLDWAAGVKEKGLIRAVGMTTHNRQIVAELADSEFIDYFHIRYNAVHRGAEEEIFPKLQGKNKGIVSFTATSWGKLMQQKKLAPSMVAATAGDCYRFVLSREEIDCCMMGVKNIKMLRDNFSRLEKGPMTQEELAWMTSIGDYLHGKRS
ncbi:MAG: aldo/keto reductase [Desulfopila sp.]|jgi:aryl-alcohol dehydrogenase-like predicted oxidoreductase|nr:aldo/keto reductase [Desulfopila sp.]